MDKLGINITTGEKNVPIIRDGEVVGELSFNPTDVLFAERFYALLGDMQKTLKEYKAQGQELAKSKKDNGGIPVNMEEHITLQRDLCNYLREKIDNVFGDGSSQKVFGDTRNLEIYKQFFDGMMPFFQQARAERVAMYTTTASAKRTRRKK